MAPASDCDHNAGYHAGCLDRDAWEAVTDVADLFEDAKRWPSYEAASAWAATRGAQHILRELDGLDGSSIETVAAIESRLQSEIDEEDVVWRLRREASTLAGILAQRLPAEQQAGDQPGDLSLERAKLVVHIESLAASAAANALTAARSRAAA
jgi:hypothetical protein